MRICVDPGHGGADPGAEANGVDEKRITLDVSLLLEWELEKRRHWVTLTRRDDSTVELLDRADFANVREADAFISIHCNASDTPAAEGIEVFHLAQSARGRALATAVLASLADMFPGHRNRGVKTARFVVLRQTRMPAILIELEFLTNPLQAEFLKSRRAQHQLAAGIADGIGLA